MYAVYWSTNISHLWSLFVTFGFLKQHPSFSIPLWDHQMLLYINLQVKWFSSLYMIACNWYSVCELELTTTVEEGIGWGLVSGEISIQNHEGGEIKPMLFIRHGIVIWHDNKRTCIQLFIVVSFSWQFKSRIGAYSVYSKLVMIVGKKVGIASNSKGS